MIIIIIVNNLKKKIIGDFKLITNRPKTEITTFKGMKFNKRDKREEER